MYVTTEGITSTAAAGRYGDGASLVDSFVPGAISNRTLEHLTETNARPQQYRAIRGEHHPASSYASSQYVLIKETSPFNVLMLLVG